MGKKGKKETRFHLSVSKNMRTTNKSLFIFIVEDNHWNRCESFWKIVDSKSGKFSFKIFKFFSRRETKSPSFGKKLSFPFNVSRHIRAFTYFHEAAVTRTDENLANEIAMGVIRLDDTCHHSSLTIITFASTCDSFSPHGSRRVRLSRMRSCLRHRPFVSFRFVVAPSFLPRLADFS